MKKGLQTLLLIVLSLTVFITIINIIPPKKVIVDNPFITKTDKPMIVAHRGGKILNPENTVKAFDACLTDYNVDVLEMDLCLTKDNELVIIHNMYINANCDVEEVTGITERHYVNDYTYDELLNYNFGYKFTNLEGAKPYAALLESVSSSGRKAAIAGENLNIVRVTDLFARYYDLYPDLLYIVEIKNDGELGKVAADILNELLTVTYPHLLKNVVIGTFHTEIAKYLEESYPILSTGASIGTAAKFIITQMLGVNLFYKGSFICLQIPVAYELKGIELKLAKQNYIDRAHRCNIAVQFWTINNTDEMKMLIDMGVDAIMTDNPQLLSEVLETY
ncbi:MAG TPA: glycerophosphodiester phosphodiesterase family protein [Bacilli bacterium]|nr:glycerophosphodiester phosphodiesterase family protein [Bacilli bacterium]